jgi:MFS family permease
MGAMRTVVRLLGGLVGAGAGFAAGALASYLIMGWLGVSDFEGQRATTAAILFGPIGGLIGIVLGSMLALRLTSGNSRAGAAVLWSGLSLVVLIAVGGAGLGLAWLGSDRPLGNNGAAPRLLFEVRIPDDMNIADNGRGVRVTLDTDRNQMPAEMTGVTDHADEWLVLAGEVELYYRTAQRLLVVDLGSGKQHIFDLGLPASPSQTEAWGPWRRVDYVVASPEQQSAAPPGPEDRSEMRSRVRMF